MKNPGKRHESESILRILGAPIVEQGRTIASLGLGAFAVQFFRNACDGGCEFCAHPETAIDGLTPWCEIDRHLTGSHGLGLICLGGDEPMLHPDFERAVRRAAATGFDRVQVMTSGLQLAVPGAARRLREAGVTELAIPIYSTQAKVHDGIFGGPSHARLLRALENAAEAGLRLRLHTLALHSNLPGLPELAEWAASRWATPLTIGMARAKPGVFAYERVVPAFTEIIARLKGTRPLLLGFPHCVIAAAGGKSAAPPQTAEIIALYFRVQTALHTRTCSACALKESCAGVIRGYCDAYGERGLTAAA